MELDAQYFLDLSDDAVPALAAAFRNKPMPEVVREKVGAALFCMRYKREEDARKIPWQAFHVARYSADRIFVEVKNHLDAYKLVNADWPVTVETPSGEEFSSYQYYD